MQLRVVSPQHDMYSISHNTLCSTTVKCMTDTQLYCLKFMFLVYTYGVCHVIRTLHLWSTDRGSTPYVVVGTYVHKYVGTYGGTLVAAVTLGLQVDCPPQPCSLALLENVVVLALKRVPALLVEVTRSRRVCGGSCPGQARTQDFEKGGYILKKIPLNFWHFNVKLFFSHDSVQEYAIS